MAYKKRRVYQSIMEEESYKITRDKLPKEWVIHEYSPDYGIDFVVEIFEYINEEHTIAETLGESFFVQLKSVNKLNLQTKKVYSRMNVEKELKVNVEKSTDIEVISFSIDVGELLTVQSMGTTMPVMLFLADLENKEMYFLCLNDYIEKILLPEEPDFENKSTKTIYIPVENKITNEEKVICQLMFYARRAKLYGAFSKFYYQRNELLYNKTFNVVKHFINNIKKFDFWHSNVKWPPLIGLYDEIILIERIINCEDIEQGKKVMECKYEAVFIDILDSEEAIIDFIIKPLWDRLCNLSNIYEEICKEWFLPTYFWNELY